jgi:hypothetical protein
MSRHKIKIDRNEATKRRMLKEIETAAAVRKPAWWKRALNATAGSLKTAAKATARGTAVAAKATGKGCTTGAKATGSFCKDQYERAHNMAYGFLANVKKGEKLAEELDEQLEAAQPSMNRKALFDAATELRERANVLEAIAKRS